MSRERDAAELTDQARDFGGPREEEPTESDFSSGKRFLDPCTSVGQQEGKKAAEVLIAIQTMVGQVNSAFGRKGKRGGNPSNNSRANEWGERCFSAVVSRTAVISGHWQYHAAFCHRCCVQGRKVSWPRWSAKVFSRIKDPPNDSNAPRAREGFFVGVTSERSKTILILRRSDGLVELEPVSSYVETNWVDPEPQEEEKEKLDVSEDGFCNVMCDDDHQQVMKMTNLTI